MSNKSSIPIKRAQLLSKEQKLMSELESEATEVESKLQSTLKILGIIGAGVLTATIIYKLSTPDTPSKKTKKNKNKGTNGRPSAVTASVISIALQKLIPLAIDRFSQITSKTSKDEKAAE